MNQESSSSVPAPQSYPNPDEINLLEYLYALIHHKWWIIILTLVGLIAGYALAFKKGPTYVCEVIVAPKETEGQKTPNFAGLGALGGMVASQLDLGGNANVAKITQVIKTRRFNAACLEQTNLLPLVYKYKMPKIYKVSYDTVAMGWKPTFKMPNMLSMGGFLAGQVKNEVTKDNTLSLKVESKDSTYSKILLTTYVEFLNIYLRTSTQNEAKENIDFLESKMNSIADPLLREKIQAMIATQVEKQMMVSREAFRIVDPPFSTVTFKQKKLFPMVFAAGLFFMSVLWIVFAHAFSSAEKTPEDKTLIEKIRKELLSI